MRPRTIILSWVVYSVVVVAHMGWRGGMLLLSLVFFISLYGVVAIMNDLSDIETDRINERRDIPYANGALTERQLRFIMMILAGVTTAVAWIIHSHMVIWAGVYMLLGYMYSSGWWVLKNRGVWATILLGVCYGAVPWLMAASVIGGEFSLLLLLLAMASCIFSMGIVVLKDFKDEKGDMATGKKTLLVRYGVNVSRSYYRAVTSVSYGVLCVVGAVFLESPWGAVVIFCTGIVNYWLLHTPDITTHPTIRRVRGNTARGLFFIVALSLYVAALS